VIYAVVPIRGGGELGKEWHDQGKMMSEEEYLHRLHRLRRIPDQSGIQRQRSIDHRREAPGGLLMGAVANMRPDLFKAIVSYVLRRM
jgi:oligopeptidase B